MNVNNMIEASRESLTILGEELANWSSLRVVSAWLALCDNVYDPEDDDAAYELRGAVGRELGWELATENLDPHGDIPWYAAYIELAAVYGTDYWPAEAMADYQRKVKGANGTEAVAAAVYAWNVAMMRYEEFRETSRKAT